MNPSVAARRLALGLLLLVAYGLPAVTGTLGLRLLVEILYLGLLATAFNLMFGYAGMLSFGFNATFGVGAYGLALALTYLPGWPLPLAALAAVALGSLAGLAIGAFCVRLRGGYFALLTLAFCQFLFAGAQKWRDVLRGEDGLPVPASSLAGVPVGPQNMPATYWIVLSVTLICLAAMARLVRAPLGNAAVLMRENDERASFLGYDVFATRLLIFTLASGFAAVAGVLFALFQGLVSPSTLSLGQGGEVLIMVVLGGSASFWGPFAGAALYVLLQDALSRATEHWQFFIGLAFVLVVLFAPGGASGLGQRLLARVRP